MLNLVPSDPIVAEPPPARRGPHPLVALASYSALILVAVVVIAALMSCGRMVDRAV